MSSAILVPRAPDSEIYTAGRALGLSDVTAKVLAARISSKDHLDAIVNPSLKHIFDPDKFKDIDKAVKVLADAIENRSVICILTDYDVDGITSHAVMYRAIVETFNHPADKTISLIGHRLKDGYGVNDNLVDRILAMDVVPDVVITADCGSSDEARIKRLADEGISVIVTDHHALPVEGAPQSAVAVINPTQKDCDYPDATIAGCMVAWLTMCAVRRELILRNYLSEDPMSLAYLLSYVALGTVADCVSLGDSFINRAVVTHGLRVINRFDEPCWRAAKRLIDPADGYFMSDALGFQIGPRINARSRLDDPYAALRYILAKTDKEADDYLAILDKDNNDRKDIERRMTESANKVAKDLLDDGHEGLSIFLTDGHSGVQGIVASRITQSTGKPSVVLCPTENEEQLSGSARSVDLVQIRDALQWIHDKDSSIFVKFGGHKGAAGLTIYKKKYFDFMRLFDQAVKAQLHGVALEPVIRTDGLLDYCDINLITYYELQDLQPYGREFDAPCFDGVFTVVGIRMLGADKTHAQLTLAIPDDNSGHEFKAIWFKAVESGKALEFEESDEIICAYKLNANKFRDNVSLQLMVEHAERR